MNRNYNIVWNSAKNMYVVASELACGDSRVKSQMRTVGLGVSLLLSASAAFAAEVGPQSGASIILQNGDTITSTTGGTGVDSSVTGGSGVQIDGGAVISITGDSGSIGVKLDNGTNNSLGDGTKIHVSDSGTSSVANSYGIDIAKTNADTHVTANNAQIDVSAENSAYGIYAAGTRSLIDLGKGSTITAESKSSGAYGVYLNYTYGSFNIDNGLIQASAGEYSVEGIYASQAKISLGNNTRIDANTGSSYGATGIDLNSWSTLTGNNVDINVTGLSNLYGVELDSNSSVNLGYGGSITISGNTWNAYGVSVTTGTSFTANGVAIDLSTTSTSSNSSFTGVDIYEGGNVYLGSGSSITSRGFHGGYGISMLDDYGNALLQADHLTVDVQGNGYMYGILQAGGEMDLGSGSSVSANGEADTIWITSGDFKADQLTVKTAQASGITAQSGSDKVNVTIGAGSVVDGRDVGASGVTNGICMGYAGYGGYSGVFNFNGTADNRNTIYAVNGYGASAQFSGQTMNISNTDIIMSGDEKTYGLWSIGNNSFTSAGIINGENLSIDMTGVKEKGYGVVVQQGGIINLSDDTTITTDGGVAIWDPKVTSSGQLVQGGTINGTGKMNIIGDIVNSGWGYIDLSMDAGSYFAGATSVAKGLGKDSVIDLTLADQAQWMMTDASSLTTLDNAGQIVFEKDDSGTWSTLNASKITLEKSSELDVDLSAVASGPLITGGDITLGGELKIADSQNITSDKQLEQLQSVTANRCRQRHQGQFRRHHGGHYCAGLSRGWRLDRCE